jgi:hypothetical protein
MHFARVSSSVVLIVVVGCLVTPAAPQTLTFSNTPLLRPDGNSRPLIAIDSEGHMALVGSSWMTCGTNFWTGSFGSTPTFQGQIDSELQKAAKLVFHACNADIDIGSTGTVHATSLIVLVNAPFRAAQVGIAAVSCPNGATNFSLSSCASKIIDSAGDDLPWITSNGTHVWISYHDAKSSALIRVQRSDDDGLTWNRVGDPIVGQGKTTGDATFNNLEGKIVADPSTGNLYVPYAAADTGVLKAKIIALNNLFVSRSTDGGKSWTASLVYHDPRLVSLGRRLAVDPVTGKLYAAWSDGQQDTFFSVSSDHGSTWSAPVTVNVAPANTTAALTNVAAYDGRVDVAYYGTTASNHLDPTAVWNVYVAQTTNDGASFTQSRVSNTSNHTGGICRESLEVCPPGGTLDMLDVFGVAINPYDGRSAVIYTDDTLTIDSSGNPLPQVVLAQQD